MELLNYSLENTFQNKATINYITTASDVTFIRVIT